MSLIKFNSDSKHYYECTECTYNGTLATIKGLVSRPDKVEGGFGVFEYADLAHTVPRLVADMSRFSLMWEDGENTIVLSSDKQIYRTYFIYDENGYINSEVTGTDVIEDNAILADEGVGRAHQEYAHIDLFDEDGFYLYKVVNGEKVDTTTAEKVAWQAEKDATALASAKEGKISEIANACATAITAGVDVGNHHYSYALTDQNNLYNAMNLATQTGLDVPYHADGENCRLFTKEELVAIYIAAETNATSEITYNNQMKQYINILTDIDDVNAITHGTPLTGVYLDTYNTMMAQAQEIIRRVIGEN